jgi:hypothetical protein
MGAGWPGKLSTNMSAKQSFAVLRNSTQTTRNVYPEWVK